MRYVKKSSKTRKSFKKNKRSKSIKSSKSFIKKVQSIIHKDVETKQSYNAFPLTYFNSYINNVADYCQVIPGIIQGVDVNQRIGENIRAMNLSIKGYMIASISNNSLNNARIAVRVMCVQPRNCSNYSQVLLGSSAWLGSLLLKGGVTTGYTGLVSDTYAPINTSQIITYYDKVFYVSTPVLYPSTSATGLTSWDLSKSARFFNINLKMKNKLLRYDDNIDTLYPQNYAPTILVGYCHMDGGTPDLVTSQIGLMYDVTMRYEDA